MGVDILILQIEILAKSITIGSFIQEGGGIIMNSEFGMRNYELGIQDYFLDFLPDGLVDFFRGSGGVHEHDFHFTFFFRL